MRLPRNELETRAAERRTEMDELLVGEPGQAHTRLLTREDSRGYDHVETWVPTTMAHLWKLARVEHHEPREEGDSFNRRYRERLGQRLDAEARRDPDDDRNERNRLFDSTRLQEMFGAPYRSWTDEFQQQGHLLYPQLQSHPVRVDPDWENEDRPEELRGVSGEFTPGGTITVRYGGDEFEGTVTSDGRVAWDHWPPRSVNDRAARAVMFVREEARTPIGPIMESTLESSSDDAIQDIEIVTDAFGDEWERVWNDDHDRRGPWRRVSLTAPPERHERQVRAQAYERYVTMDGSPVHVSIDADTRRVSAEQEIVEREVQRRVRDNTWEARYGG